MIKIYLQNHPNQSLKINKSHKVKKIHLQIPKLKSQRTNRPKLNLKTKNLFLKHPQKINLKKKVEP